MHFVQLPPDSSGKRVLHGRTTELHVDVLGSIQVGSTVVGQVSGATGRVSNIDPLGGGGYRLTIKHQDGVSATFGVEPLVHDGVAVATINSTPEGYYTQRVEVQSSRNPHVSMAVNDDGSVPTKLIGLDAFQRLRVSQTHYLAEHMFVNDERQQDGSPMDWTERLEGGATITHHPEYAGLLFTTGTGAGAIAQRTTDLYHRYIPGTAHVVEMTAACGDTGKTDVVRRWGYYDDRDGVFFELDGTELSVVLRSSSTGSIEETRIPQSEWSSDRLDGLGVSTMNIDVSKDCIYWIDLQFLGAGTVRFGVFHDGEVITAHELHNDNRKNVSYMRSGSLPLRAEQFNKGVVASTSEFRVFCMVVKTEGGFQPRTYDFSRTRALTGVGNTETYSASMRPSQLYEGRDNRNWIEPEQIHVYATKTCIVRLYKDATLTAPVWGPSESDDETAEVDVDATAFTGGRCLKSIIVPAGTVQTLDLREAKCICARITRRADITKFHTVTLTIECIEPGQTADVHYVHNWKEVRT